MKLSEMKDHTVEELQAKILDTRKELFQMRIQKASYKLENTSEIKKKRRSIAQMKTVIKQKITQSEKIN